MSDKAASPGGIDPDVRFSDAVSELEAIVRELEAGTLDLEDSISRYERGVALLEVCRAKLENAQQRVTSLMGEAVEMTLEEGWSGEAGELPADDE